MKEATEKSELEGLRKRYGQMSGGVVQIKVGGSTEVEIGEELDRLDDAFCATKAAQRGGILPGGGTALFRASRVLSAD